MNLSATGILSRDHNATSYSTETDLEKKLLLGGLRRDHNATSYSTETIESVQDHHFDATCRDHNATSYSTETPT